MVVPDAHHDIPSFRFRDRRKPPWGAISLDLWTRQLSGLFDFLLVRLCLDPRLDAVRMESGHAPAPETETPRSWHFSFRSGCIARRAGSSRSIEELTYRVGI